MFGASYYTAVPLWRRNLRHFNRKIDLLSQIDLSELSPINGASQCCPKVLFDSLLQLAREKSFRKASKVLFSALLCWVWESERSTRRRTEQKESNYGKFMVWSKHIFSLFKWIHNLQEDTLFYYTWAWAPIVLFATEKSHFKKSWNNVNNAALHSFSIHSFMLANEHFFFEKY